MANQFQFYAKVKLSPNSIVNCNGYLYKTHGSHITAWDYEMSTSIAIKTWIARGMGIFYSLSRLTNHLITVDPLMDI